MNKKLSVLIIDDEEEIIKTITRYLAVSTDLNLNIHTAMTYDQAIDIINKKKPVIIVSDIALPDGDGLDIIKQARKMSYANQVITITAFSNIENVIKALESGASDFLCKPIDLKEFETIFREAVQRYFRWYKLFSDTLKKQ